MPRIPYFDPDTAPEHIVRALAGKRKINVFRMVANAENCAPEVLALGHKLSRGSSLDPVHREVVILRVAHLTGAAYQWHEHNAVAKRVGFTQDKIDAVAAHPIEAGQESGGPGSSGPEPSGSEFSEFERTLLGFTDAVVRTSTAPDELFAAVAAEYDRSRLVELVLLIGFYMMVGRVMNTFELELQTEAVDTYRLRLE
ncbi:MAG TPA: carboxymuconolactone decarboxylase family protein [Nocardia sp.]|uniref:carboxymuconolactone decarboxylase family protein n=1 Tax=Nocardia sp. TaxID=1821 RepID=UPI002B4B837A|nr:carboxymuconolactone decarboxylase family protein [Nocardia sp.]HLS76955.1 carboxymuconolactone decarboxylase family protein [Nocardia sp.]